MRVETARRLLETSERCIEQVADAAGFRTPESLRRAFGRRVELSPSEYRARFWRALRSGTMQIDFLLFDEITALDAVGPYEVLARLPGASLRFVGLQKGCVACDGGLSLHVDATLEEVSASDLLVVPGGFGARKLQSDERVLAWLRAIDRTTRLTTSVCTGSVAARCGGSLARASCDHALGPLRSAGGPRRDAGRGACRPGRQVPDSSRRLRGHRSGAHARAGAGGRKRSPRRSSFPTSTTRAAAPSWQR